MTAIRKLSQFRQLSLSCESPPSTQRRKSLKKQFSEEVHEIKNAWFDGGNEIRVSLNSKIKKDSTDRPPPIKVAWGDAKSQDVRSEDAVIIKKYKEIGRPPSRKLTRHGSLEKDSILYSKQDLTERLRQPINLDSDKDEKPNLKIFLAHNTRDFENNEHSSQNEITDQYLEKSYDNNNKPRLKHPLVTNIAEKNSFQIRKTKPKGPNEPLCSPKTKAESTSRPAFTRSNTVVVVPIVETEKTDNTAIKEILNNDTPEINIIIRPATAASRREKFQKRTNSAFHSTVNTVVKDPVTNNNINNNNSSTSSSNNSFRPPLIRSSSAPASRSEKGKFLATKRKIKGSKRPHSKSKEFSESGNSSCDQTEWKNASPHSNEIETMISLVSPSESDNEETIEDEKDKQSKEKEKSKPVLKQPTTPHHVEKPAPTKEENTKEPVKSMTLRKAVKSVTFQQSSIHAIRSFSASFPARRGSMATALTLSNDGNNVAKSHSTIQSQKSQEKRSTNSSTPDADERVPKRRLVRSNTTDNSKTSLDKPDDVQIDKQKPKTAVENMKISVEIQSKSNRDTKRNDQVDVQEAQEKLPSTEEPENPTDRVEDLPQYKTPKEKQCWDMYCKMTTKGIAVSYDTILRGLLTPTEYRMRRKGSIADEMKLQMANDSKLAEFQPITNFEEVNK